MVYNICFGLERDEGRLSAVVKACALEADLAQVRRRREKRDKRREKSEKRKKKIDKRDKREKG